MYGGQCQPGQLGNPSFRSDYQGVINGMGSIINLSYAGIGFFAYGKQLIETSTKIMLFLVRGMKNGIIKAVSLGYLRQFF